MDEVKKVALWITGIITALIVSGAIILVICLASMEAPKQPTLSNSTSASEQEVKVKEITNYKDIVSSLQSQRTNIYDFVVLKTLLPLFNSLIVTVLTYIFAKTALQAYSNYIAEKYKR
jgi:uncharacterized membrane protein YeiB